MSPKSWPILDLDVGATEKEIRRAYAARLRECRPDDDPERFAELRAEFEAALGASTSRARIPHAAPAPTPPRSEAAGPLHADAEGVPRNAPVPVPVPERSIPAPAQLVVASAPIVVESAGPALAEIRALIAAGDLFGACERYDRARAAHEIALSDERPIELELAACFLRYPTRKALDLAALARRYGWDDALSGFPLTPQIVARYAAAIETPLRPGERFRGDFNWGAFWLTPFWLIAHRRLQVGITLLVLMPLLLLVPFGLFVVARIAFSYGRRGNQIAAHYRPFRDDEHFVSVQRRWAKIGLIAGVPLLLLLVANFFHRAGAF